MNDPSERRDDGTMSFGDHLEELRRRVLLAGAPALPLSIVLFYFSDTFIRLVVLPVRRVLENQGLPPNLQALALPEVLLIKLKLSLILSAVILAPWIVWQTWLFIRPGLYAQEQRFVRFLIPGSVVLTLSGVALLYFVMLPLMLQVLVAVGAQLDLGQSAPDRHPEVAAIIDSGTPLELRTAPPAPLDTGQAWISWPDMDLHVVLSETDESGTPIVEIVPPQPPPAISQSYRLHTYVNFVLLLLLGIVIAFQMPLVIVLLGWLGLASPEWLRAQRKYALFICGGLSALLTPADVVSMMVMLFPLYGLYELGILLLWLAPASRVSEGKIFRRGARPGDPDKPVSGSGQPVETAQPESTVARSPDGAGANDQPASDAADEGRDDQ